MEEIAIHVETEINLTESEQKVREAIENIFGPMNTQNKRQHKGNILQANTSSQDALIKFHNLLQREHIRAAARAVLLGGMGKNRISFCLNKQVAHAGHVSFSQEAGESPPRAVTHAHANHLQGLPQSLRKCQKILMTKATKDLIDAMQGPSYLKRGHVQPLDYGHTLQYEDERITLHKADHILGAAQIMVEDKENQRIVFTGDFRIDETPILDSDVLRSEERR